MRSVFLAAGSAFGGDDVLQCRHRYLETEALQACRSSLQVPVRGHPRRLEQHVEWTVAGHHRDNVDVLEHPFVDWGSYGLSVHAGARSQLGLHLCQRPCEFSEIGPPMGCRDVEVERPGKLDTLEDRAEPTDDDVVDAVARQYLEDPFRRNREGHRAALDIRRSFRAAAIRSRSLRRLASSTLAGNERSYRWSHSS